MFTRHKVSAGCPYPLGATVDAKGVNFALFSAHAESVELCIFDSHGRREVQRIPMLGHTEQIWHCHIQGFKAGIIYGYRVHGPYEPEKGHRFNPNKLLLDPYAKKLFGRFRWSTNMLGYDSTHEEQDLILDARDNAQEMVKGVVVDDGELQTRKISVTAPTTSWQNTVIYEMHVKGYTKLHAAIPVNERGTFAGLARPKILKHIRQLGVSAIELLPVHSFIDERFLLDHGLTNYWGYNTLNFFSPHSAYLAGDSRLEFKRLVDAAHDEGLEVILDVVYNHTAEGNHLGPTLSFRGIDNASYYSLLAQSPRFYANDTGCGNTLNIRHPRVLQMVMDSLRFWAGNMGVDGFRFDLATVMGREANGFDAGGGFFDAIRQDPVLARCKMIAEPWDIGPGGYQLGGYPIGWTEWNDRYRDTVRQFWRGDPGLLPEFARRIHGSSDIFEYSGRPPSTTINFVCSHDGFTLNDLVSYKERHNLVNKENNNDGHHSNFSDNHGEEGLTKNSKVIEVRNRQKRNFIATLFLSQGTPMLLAGDELGRTQDGNNNAYCQDNPINWIDWQSSDEDGHLLQQFTQNVIALRRRYPLFTSKVYIHRPDEPEMGDFSSVRWYSAAGEEMRDEQWGEHNVRTLGWMLEKGCFVEGPDIEKCMLLVIFNASNEPQPFCLPSHPSICQWRCLLDTNSGDGSAKKESISSGAEIMMPQKNMQVLEAVLEG